ncbi:Retrovirus-related Pol polyprotein from transposon RE1 [Vitis vinifera]|uniref:Retrovirus-related Pol polyprotein from transposon RE1 n=1 Tax=Vitis vinifera TaxID=29760 RepID=A0A438HFM7_VITVI|nr:Retrovirus-related Pol polyprotein from transposon RE1 [Vitis vinifera]
MNTDDKFFMVLTLIGLHPDLETVRDKILGSSSVPPLDDVFASLLRISPLRLCHLITLQILLYYEYDDYLRYQATKSASVTSVAQTGNASACLTHTSSLGPWILDSGASDHISGIGLAHPLPSLPLTSVLHTPETEYGEDDWHRTTNFLPQPQNASSWDTPDFKRVIVVIPLRLIATFCPLMSPSLKTHHSSPPLSLFLFLKYLLTHFLSLRLSPAPALPPSVDLPITLRKVGCHWVYTVKVDLDGQIASVRLLLSMAAMRSWPLYQLDIKNAFLHGDLAEEVYMEQPPGFVAQGVWFSVTTDHSVFYHHNSSGQCIYLVVYVDDIVITGSDQNDIQKLKQHLFTHFQTKDLGKLKYFLGIEIAQSSSGVVLSQRKYALDILEETGQGEPIRDPGRYRRLHTRLRCVVQEQRSYRGCWLHRCRLVGSPTYRRSTSGYYVFIGGNVISWKSKKQDVVARSSAKAKYRAMALTTCELIWLKHLLRELRFWKR